MIEITQFDGDRPVMREEHIIFRVPAVAFAGAGN
jgi:hypothetical protein